MSQKKDRKDVKKPRGTKDILPSEALIYQKIQETCQRILNNNGYQPIILPSYEYADLFSSSLGESSDIVHKEMFAFVDRKGRNLVLRPEGTASTVRLVSQNKLVNNYPLRLYYWGSMFRYERPQKGRYREFTQLGIELINARGIMADGELFWLIKAIFLALDLPKFTINWNYLGSENSKQKYKEILKLFLANKQESLCLDCQRRYNDNPLRILDCKVCEKMNFPNYSHVLNQEELNYKEEIAKLFNSLKISNEYNSCLVRGLDYYTGIVFEVYLANIGQQSALLGGGRYDKLFQRLRGQDLPAAGLALGIGRLIDFLSPDNKPDLDILFLMLDYAAHSFISDWRENLSQKYKIVSNLEINKVKNLFKSIDYYSPKLAIIVGKKELKEKKILVRDCQTKQDFLVSEEELVNWVSSYLSKFKTTAT